MKDRYEYLCQIEEQPRFCFSSSIVYRKIDTKREKEKIECREHSFWDTLRAEANLYYLLQTILFEDNFKRKILYAKLFYRRVTNFSGAQAFLPGSSITAKISHESAISDGSNSCEILSQEFQRQLRIFANFFSTMRPFYRANFYRMNVFFINLRFFCNRDWLHKQHKYLKNVKMVVL